MNIAITKSEEKNESWKKTPLTLKRHNRFVFRGILNRICGPVIFGKRCPESTTRAINKLLRNLERSVDWEFYTHIPEGKIIKETPSFEHCVKRMTTELEGCRNFYHKYNGYISVTDTWAEHTMVRKCSPLYKESGNNIIPLKHNIPDAKKRFYGKIISEDEYLKECSYMKGFISEAFIVSFLNSSLKCPECSQIGKLGLSGGTSSSYTTSFRDAVCLGCKEKGVTTLFEIKCRNANRIKVMRGTIEAGNYVALNTLLAKNVNIYIVVVARDTGEIHIGKVKDATPKGSSRWLYTIQENLSWGNPSSLVTYTNKKFTLPVKMIPLDETLTDKYMKKIAETSFLKLKSKNVNGTII